RSGTAYLIPAPVGKAVLYSRVILVLACTFSFGWRPPRTCNVTAQLQTRPRAQSRRRNTPEGDNHGSRTILALKSRPVLRVCFLAPEHSAIRPARSESLA